MTIDWFTVSAQIVNFLVLVYLLKRFLYGPILRAMDRREQDIAARLRDADFQVQAAAQEKEQYTGKRRELEAERDAIFEQAREEAREEHSRAVDDLRTEIASRRDEWRKALEREQSILMKDVRASLSERVRAAIERVLADLANADLEQEVLKRFMRQLRDVSGDERDALASKAKSERVPITFATAFALGNEQRKAITAELHEILAPDIDVRFERRDELVCGIALEVAGRRYSWSVDGYLEDLSATINETLAGAEKGLHGG